jgi:hypothetical protein
VKTFVAMMMLTGYSVAADITPAQTEKIFLVTYDNTIEAVQLQMQCWLLGCKGYEGKKGIERLAKENLAQRTQFMDEMKKEIEYRKGNPEIVAELKAATVTAIDIFDNGSPGLNETKTQFKARIQATHQAFTTQMSKVKASIELAN